MNSDPESFTDDLLPPAFLADLRTIQRTPAVPAAVDARVRNEARAYLARQRRIRTWVRVAGGLAAVVLVVVGVRIVTQSMFSANDAPTLASQEGPPAPSAAMSPAGAVPGVNGSQADASRTPTTLPSVVNANFLKPDVDRSGTVDILDAFAVARGVKSGRTSIGWDVDGDGVVDQRDVDQIAQIAVRVKGGLQ